MQIAKKHTMNGNARVRERSREGEGERERETYIHIYIHIWGLTMCPTFWHTRVVFPLRATSSGIHNSILVLQQTDRERERGRESEQERSTELLRLHTRDKDSSRTSTRAKRRSQSRFGAQGRLLQRHGWRWKRTLAETSLFSCSWIVKGLGRVTYNTVRKVAKTEQSVLSSSDRHNQNLVWPTDTD